MKAIPVLTEKSLGLAKEGKYTFWVDPKLTKNQIKNIIDKIFGVNCVSIRTINFKGGTRKNFRGRKITIKARKKAIVTLKEKQKIDLFEEKTK